MKKAALAIALVSVGVVIGAFGPKLWKKFSASPAVSSAVGREYREGRDEVGRLVWRVEVYKDMEEGRLLPHGEFMEYYPKTGEVRVRGQFDRGLRIGWWYKYGEDAGGRTAKCLYEHGEEKYGTFMERNVVTVEGGSIDVRLSNRHFSEQDPQEVWLREFLHKTKDSVRIR